MRVRIEIEPNDLVREAQKQKRSLTYKEAHILLKKHEEFLLKPLRNLKDALVKSVLGVKA